MRFSLLVVIAIFALVTDIASAGCHRKCVPHWAGPSPAPHSGCHHVTGALFATCDCQRAYTSSHVVGFGGECCYRGHGRHVLASAYCNRSTSSYYPECEYCGVFDPHLGGYADPDMGNLCSGTHRAFGGWERLGTISNDSAAAGDLDVLSGALPR